jgi:hypothetical protein
MSPIVIQFTYARRGACYVLTAGDFRGPVTGAAGTRNFEPDGVAFCASLALQNPPTGDGDPHSSPVTLCGRSRRRFMVMRTLPNPTSAWVPHKIYQVLMLRRPRNLPRCPSDRVGRSTLYALPAAALSIRPFFNPITLPQTLSLLGAFWRTATK